jgi:hypothetical protein
MGGGFTQFQSHQAYPLLFIVTNLICSAGRQSRNALLWPDALRRHNFDHIKDVALT